MLSRGREAPAIPDTAGCAARRWAPRRTPGEAARLGPGSNPDCATVSLMTRRRAISPFREAGRDVHPYPTEKPWGYCRRFARRQAAAVRRRGTWAHHRPPGMAGPGPHERPEEAAPRTGHAQPRAHPEGAAAAVARQAGPPGSAYPSGPGPPQLPARQSHASADGHRFPALTATSSAGSPMLLRLRPAAAAASASAHLPAVGQRRHQPTGAGTRQWRLGRRVGAEGAHAATGAAMSQKRAGLR